MRLEMALEFALEFMFEVALSLVLSATNASESVNIHLPKQVGCYVHRCTQEYLFWFAF